MSQHAPFAVPESESVYTGVKTPLMGAHRRIPRLLQVQSEVIFCHTNDAIVSVAKDVAMVVIPGEVDCGREPAAPKDMTVFPAEAYSVFPNICSLVAFTEWSCVGTPVELTYERKGEVVPATCHQRADESV